MLGWCGTSVSVADEVGGGKWKGAKDKKEKREKPLKAKLTDCWVEFWESVLLWDLVPEDRLQHCLQSMVGCVS